MISVVWCLLFGRGGRQQGKRSLFAILRLLPSRRQRILRNLFDSSGNQRSTDYVLKRRKQVQRCIQRQQDRVVYAFHFKRHLDTSNGGRVSVIIISATPLIRN